jgi:SnoaL-like domain
MPLIGTRYASVRVLTMVVQPLAKGRLCGRLKCSSSGAATFSMTAEDKLDVIQVCHEFDAVLNGGDYSELSRLWAPDGTLTVEPGVPGAPPRSISGVPAIMEYFASVKGRAAGNRHLTANIIVHPDGPNTARACGYRLLHRAACPPALIASGLIKDHLVKGSNGEWRFQSRHFVMDPPM